MDEEELREPGADLLTIEQFAALWLTEWRFSLDGKCDDAAEYVNGVLRAIRDGDSYLETIGNIQGQQQFMFQWLLSNGLIERGRSTRHHVLTTKGRVVLATLDAGVHYEFLDLYEP